MLTMPVHLTPEAEAFRVIVFLEDNGCLEIRQKILAQVTAVVM
jgi:hypothetical protein